MVKHEEGNDMILIRQDFKNSHVSIIEVYQENKNKENKNMQEMDIKTCLTRIKKNI